jgi:hypothetical protein
MTEVLLDGRFTASTGAAIGPACTLSVEAEVKGFSSSG